MAVIPALMSGVQFTGFTSTTAQLGAVTGTIVAIPTSRRHGGDIAISASVAFGGAPGASSFKLFISNDGVNFVDSALTISDAATLVKTLLPGITHLRFDQVSKTNAVTATGIIVMG